MKSYVQVNRHRATLLLKTVPCLEVLHTYHVYFIPEGLQFFTRCTKWIIEHIKTKWPHQVTWPRGQVRFQRKNGLCPKSHSFKHIWQTRLQWGWSFFTYLSVITSCLRYQQKFVSWVSCYSSMWSTITWEVYLLAYLILCIWKTWWVIIIAVIFICPKNWHLSPDLFAYCNMISFHS